MMPMSVVTFLMLYLSLSVVALTTHDDGLVMKMGPFAFFCVLYAMHESVRRSGIACTLRQPSATNLTISPILSKSFNVALKGGMTKYPHHSGSKLRCPWPSYLVGECLYVP